MNEQPVQSSHTRTSDPSGPACVALALGSNLASALGDRESNIRSALSTIARAPSVGVIAVSSLHETRAWGPVPQGDYLNAACLIETTLAPHALLGHLHDIERAFGRDRVKELRFGPRTLDLDILLYADLILNDPDLTIPHPRMHQRAFVLEPLAEIAPEHVHPHLHRSIADLLRSLRASA